MASVWIYLFCVSLMVIGVIPVLSAHSTVSAEDMNTSVVPTKYRLLLLEIKTPPPVVSSPLIQHQEEKKESIPAEIEAVSAKSTPVPPVAAAVSPPAANNAMGKGRVSTNFAESIEQPGTRVDNRERYTFSGLFDVHVTHSFS